MCLKKIAIIFSLCLLICNIALAKTLPNPDTSAVSACLIDADDNGVLYGKDEDKIMHPASTTKIMTAILALESGKLDEPLVITPEAVNTEPSSLGLRLGDKITLREALTGMMIVSGNDAAVAVAQTVAGSVPAFAKMMNDKAKELGAVNTHFLNPHGLTAQGHYSTAHDMAIIASYAMKKPEFREIVSKKAYNMKYMDGHTEYVTTREKKTLIAVFYNDEYRWDDAPTWLKFSFRFYDPSELQDKTVVSKQNVIKLNKITEQRIKHSRETNKNLAALDAAIVNKAKSLNNKTIDVVDTAQQTKAKDVDVAENTKVEVSSDVDNNINNDEYKENNSSEENVEVVSDVTADMNTTEITTPEELNPSLEKYVY